ncbi:MAG TPA: FHA domain-containing protein [Polyangiaceae bacterium]|jgi:hypothetical protein|nr:FHA domain-containing protein [Polyangiaceae bacterium]
MLCSNGHDSSELDYCSICGSAMSPRASAASAAGAPAAGPAGTCPSCGEPRTDASARFCEVCRFDFRNNRPGPAPMGRSSEAPAAPSPPPAPSPVAPPVTNASAAPTDVRPSAWELVVAIDPALDVEPDPSAPCPAKAPKRVVAVDRDLLVGREDDRRDIHPDLALADPGTSRRHAKIVRSADGTLALQDLASTNGTKLNGVDVAAGSRRPIRDGDQITLGRWTRIIVRGRP